MKKYEEEQVLEFLGYFDRMLAENPKKSGWFVGDKVKYPNYIIICRPLYTNIFRQVQ